MNYIVIDLEYNQFFDFKKEWQSPPNPILPLEIIQIGAIKLDENLKIIGDFDATIRPKLYRTLNPYVARVTHLTNHELRNSPAFSKVYSDLKKFIGNNKTTLCFWGNDDMRTLIRNILFLSQDISGLPLEYINIQRIASTYLNVPAKQQLSLSYVVSSLAIDAPLTFHNAVNDAYYTAKIFQKVSSQALGLNIHSFDYNGFLSQFLTQIEKPKKRNKK